MHNASLSNLAVCTLKALAAAGRPTDVAALGDQLGCGPADVRRALVALRREGLVDGSLTRLTLSGLALGAGLRAQRLRAVRFQTRELAAA